MSGDRCGKTGGYQAHIDNGTPTCQPCRDLQARWQRHYRTRLYLAGGPMLVDACGVRRRLQALVRNGWTFDVLGERLGVSGAAARAWSSNATVRRSTAARVARLYDELWDRQGPSRKSAARARTRGWLPAMAWSDDDIDDPAATPASTRDIDAVDEVDELAVEAVLEGVRLQLAGATAHAAVHALHARGVPAAVVAERIGIQERQVERLKARDTAPHRKTNNYLGETA